MDVKEMKERLLRLDEDADLLFPEDINFICYIVGGGALILMGYIARATHDIDILETIPNELKNLYAKYDMNNLVSAYSDNFPQGYEKRAIKLDLPTKRITYYTLSLEDLVISKLCTTRYSQDIVDIENENVINSLDWKLLQELADELKLTMISSVSYNSFYSNYKEYVRRFCHETIDT
jgi:hypothetical protein